MLGKHINHCEDSLTAAVFTHLLHLPAELFWQILCGACYTKSLPKNPGEPEVFPWPTWDARGSDNECRVIPDVFLRFADFDLIIEAKRWDEGMQNPVQWKNELISYTNEYGSEMRPVRMVALAGVHNHQDHQLTYEWSSAAEKSADNVGHTHLFICPVHMCRWSSLLLECQRMATRLGKEIKNSQTCAHLRILADMVDLFAWHGFVPARWFADFDFKPNLLDSSADSDQALFRRISLQFRTS